MPRDKYRLAWYLYTCTTRLSSFIIVLETLCSILNKPCSVAKRDLRAYYLYLYVHVDKCIYSEKRSGYEEQERKTSSITHRERIVDLNSVSPAPWRGIRFLIGEQSPENSHFVPARRVSVADSTSCLFRRQTIVPSFVYRASRLEKNEAHRCREHPNELYRASSRVCV